MKVELERLTTANGERSIRLSASDTTVKAETVRQWIKMLQLAERWLKEGPKVNR